MTRTPSRFLWTVCWGFLGLASPAAARTIAVPQELPTIQAAVNAAVAGDTIVVAPGDYVAPVRVRDNRHGLTIEAADPANPPIIHGLPYVKHDGINIERVNDVTIRNVVVLDAYDAVRLNQAHNTLLENVRVERNALGVRVNRSDNVRLIGCTIVDTLVESSVLFENSPGGLVENSMVLRGLDDGIRLSKSPCVQLRNNLVLDADGDGFDVDGSSGTRIEGCTAIAAVGHGFRVSNTMQLGLSGNTAASSGNSGLWISKSPPFATVADVLAQGNTASGSLKNDIIVFERRSSAADVPACPAPPSSTTTTTTRPVPTTTSTTTTRPPTTIVTTTVTTTVTTSTSTTRPPTTTTTIPPTPPGPSTSARWRFSIRIAKATGAETNVNVPLRTTDAPVDAAILTEHVAAFRLSRHVAPNEIAALGGDTLPRLTAAAEAYMRSRPADYPGLASVVQLLWAARVP